MNGELKNCSGWPRRDGLTLIEVVAGLLLMSTLLVGILMACGRHVRQVKRAQQRLAAATLADRILEQWFRDPQQNLLGNNNEPSEASGLTWRMRLVEGQDEANEMNLEIVRLEIVDTESSMKLEPLVAVEVVKPLRQTNVP